MSCVHWSLSSGAAGLTGQNRPRGIEWNDILHCGAGFPYPPPPAVVRPGRPGRFLVPLTFHSQARPVEREAISDVPGIEQCLYVGQPTEAWCRIAFLCLPRRRRLESGRTVGIPYDAALEIACTKWAPDPFPRQH
jgi:hypothetical protein